MLEPHFLSSEYKYAENWDNLRNFIKMDMPDGKNWPLTFV